MNLRVQFVAVAVCAAAAFASADTGTNDVGLATARRPLHLTFVADFASAYLSSSGRICDTRPVASQELDFKYSFGDNDWVDGYGWIVSSLHDRQHESHRELFNEFEGSVMYGHSFRPTERTKFICRVGALWNPTLGYHPACWEYWGPRVALRFDNPWVVPYLDALWLLRPEKKGRVKLGLNRAFKLTDTLTLTPSVETVWNDGVRFESSYGAAPDSPVFGGAFTALTTGLRLDWQVSEAVSLYVRYRQLDVFNPQARKSNKESSSYYVKNDYPVFSAGVTWSF